MFGSIIETSNAWRKVEESGYTLERLFKERFELFTPEELSEVFREYVNGAREIEEEEHWKWGLAEKLVEKEGEKIKKILDVHAQKEAVEIGSKNEWRERERMKKVRVVEFWTGYPNKPIPTTEEKRKALSIYRSRDTATFERRLSAYNLPIDISDEDLLNWNGEPLI